ncbi:MAG TPA: hypothetical protein VFT69_18910, partial [Pseudolabrys sp.]|nr:hypothetical protein [Pseudolabrys sp.]
AKGNDGFAAEVSITGSKDGWFRIHEATINNYGFENAPTRVFKGTGWVSGRHLGLLLNRNYLYRDSSERAPVVAKLGSGPDSFVVDRLVACRADWVKVEGTYLGTRLRGWARGTCANQATTCP